MTITTATLTTEIKTALNRGSTYDADIPIALRDAIDTLERGHGFVYAEQEQEVTLAEDAFEFVVPNLTVSSNPLVPRNVLTEGIKYKNAPYRPIPKVERRQFRDRVKGRLNGWALKRSTAGLLTVEFDNMAQEDTPLLVNCSFYTSANTDTAICQHPQLIKAQAMLYLTPILRSAVLRNHWTDRFQQALDAAYASEDDQKYEGNDLTVQPYADELDELRYPHADSN